MEVAEDMLHVEKYGKIMYFQFYKVVYQSQQEDGKWASTIYNLSEQTIPFFLNFENILFRIRGPFSLYVDILFQIIMNNAQIFILFNLISTVGCITHKNLE